MKRGGRMTNEELKELFKFILNSENCKEINKKIIGIENSEVLHTIAYNMEYHTIYNYESGRLCIENAIIDNPRCDLGTAMLLFYFQGGLSYLHENNIRYNKIVSLINKITADKGTRFLEKVYKKIMDSDFEANISYKPKIGKIELTAFKKRNIEVPKIFLEKTPGTEQNFLKIWYK